MKGRAPAMADTYERVRQSLHGTVLRESPGPGRVGELELQAKIYGGEFGVDWRGEDGETIEVVHFGTWNREPGPDFCGAKILIDGLELSGDIEIDGDARDWEAHGHAGNEAFDQVILHIFFRKGPRRFFTRSSQSKSIPQVCLRESLAVRPPPAGRLGGKLDEARALRLIEAAAKYRLRAKAVRFRRAARLCGRDDALFQALATGLGYRNNKIPFLLTAQRAGLARARGKEGEALLFGLAGFLQAEIFDQADDESRGYLRGLWETWWTIRSNEGRLILPASAWKFAALRPANHPHRRMGALAGIARLFARISRAIDGQRLIEFRQILGSLDHPYWRGHASLGREAMARPAALIGEDRILDLVINAFLPGLELAEAWKQLSELPGPTPNRKVLTMTAWLCGTAGPAFGRSAMQQQGLLQLHEDFLHCDPLAVWEDFSHGDG